MKSLQYKEKDTIITCYNYNNYNLENQSFTTIGQPGLVTFGVYVCAAIARSMCESETSIIFTLASVPGMPMMVRPAAMTSSDVSKGWS